MRWPSPAPLRPERRLRQSTPDSMSIITWTDGRERIVITSLRVGPPRRRLLATLAVGFRLLWWPVRWAPSGRPPRPCPDWSDASPSVPAAACRTSPVEERPGNCAVNVANHQGQATFVLRLCHKKGLSNLRWHFSRCFFALFFCHVCHQTRNQTTTPRPILLSLSKQGIKPSPPNKETKALKRYPLRNVYASLQ